MRCHTTVFAARSSSRAGPGIGQHVGDLTGTLPTQLRRSSIAVDRPRGGARATIRITQIACCFEVLGDQRRVLVMLADGGRDSPMKLVRRRS